MIFVASLKKIPFLRYVTVTVTDTVTDTETVTYIDSLIYIVIIYINIKSYFNICFIVILSMNR